MDADYYRRRHQALKSAGRCVNCGKRDERTISGKTLCARCAEINNACRKARYLRHCAAGVCPHCGKRPSEEGHIYCAACMADMRERGKKRREGTS